jgi:hypothetical protein
MRKELLLVIVFQVLALFMLPFLAGFMVAESNISKNVTDDNKDKLLFENKEWDMILGNTKYCSRQLRAGVRRMVCMEIADRHQGACNKGIGFGCSIYDDPFPLEHHPKLVDHSSRMATACIQRINRNCISIVFLDTINWISLQYNRPAFIYR